MDHIQEHDTGGSLNYGEQSSQRQHRAEYGQRTPKHRNTRSVHTLQ